jgi:hypothetical protein
MSKREKREKTANKRLAKLMTEARDDTLPPHYVDMIRDLNKLVRGKPLNAVAPLLLGALARCLWLEAQGDEACLTLLTLRACENLRDTLEALSIPVGTPRQ